MLVVWKMMLLRYSVEMLMFGKKRAGRRVGCEDMRQHSSVFQIGRTSETPEREGGGRRGR